MIAVGEPVAAAGAGNKVVIPFGETDFIEAEPRPVGFFCRLLRRAEPSRPDENNVVIAEYSADLFAEIVRLAHCARAEWCGQTLRYT